ncbi:protoporphyrinogen/coproporphyrinogen oxidase [Lysinibacter cavernae]|uniref:Oxygen-dependent protoporphyrinogen oxidase n=1 Tax=Lysinibacter cavernae TaxID=1640652 RepID=A0A7X5R280_9MICO|nr:FAD-dependent oxidoreductase [Lysinibacter cavernae]NIH54328.1 oxygen-dependent protoporphyrinogen oxidase [Lysinibacter cavernae]
MTLSIEDVLPLVLPENSPITVVIGGGIGGLTAALHCARNGHRVTLLEKNEAVGGIVSRHTLAGVNLDGGAESFSKRSPRVPEFLETLGLGQHIVTPSTAGTWLFSADASGKTHTAPLPRTGLLGIPGSPLARDVRRVIGLPGAIRAASDRWRKPDASFEATTLGQLVRARLGPATLDRLVRPVVGGVYAADPDTLAVDAISPSLRAKLLSTGSLTKAVKQLSAQAEPGSAVRGVEGGNYEIVLAIVAELEALGATITTGEPVTRLRRRDHGWTVDDTLQADNVILACEPVAAASLLAGVNRELVPFTAQPNATRIDTIVVKEAKLNGAPRGTGMLLGQTHGLVTAQALTHQSVKWPWLAKRLERNIHVIRLTYREEASSLTNGVLVRSTDATESLRNASILLGVSLTEKKLLDNDSVTWTQWPVTPASVRSIVAKLPNYPGLGITGSWVTGTGLASVIPGSLDEAERIVQATRPH